MHWLVVGAVALIVLAAIGAILGGWVVALGVLAAAIITGVAIDLFERSEYL